MITLNDQKEIAALKREWESYELMVEQFPGNTYWRKIADALELKIMELESRGGN
jgi:hypothetical protein